MDPEAWRDLLNARLDARQPKIAHFEAYYEGQHRLAFATSKFREAFGMLFSAFSDNWCGVVVDAPVERMEVQGFRFGEDQADEDAWRIWQGSDLDAGSVVAQETSVATGYSYLLVSPDPDEERRARITVEHPGEMIVATAPGDRRRRLAALKKWVDEEGHACVTLYLPDGIHKWRTRDKWKGGKKPKWVVRSSDDEEVDSDGFAGDNPLGVVPVLPLLNRPTMRGEGRSDLVGVIPLQDAVNKLVADMLVASEFAAFRQRWASGIEVPVDPETGQPMRQVFDAAIDRIFATGNNEAKFGSFDATDLKNYVAAVETIVQHIAAQTRTPPHYLLGQSGAFPSGESLKSTETGLVARVKRKMIVSGEAYEEAIRLALRLEGETEKAEAPTAETIWRDPESRTEGELVDSLTKMKTLGVPRRALWEKWGASPTQITRWEAMAAEEGLQAAAEDFARVFGPGGQGVPAELPPGDPAAAATE